MLVIQPVPAEKLPTTVVIKKRRYKKTPQSAEFVDEVFSSDDESPPKKMKSKVVVVPKPGSSKGEQSKSEMTDLQVTVPAQPEITIQIDGNLSDDSIDDKIEEMMVADGEYSGEVGEVKEKETERGEDEVVEEEKEETGSIKGDTEGVEVIDESDSESGSSSSSSDDEGSGSEDENDEHEDKEKEKESPESPDKTSDAATPAWPLKIDTVPVGVMSDIEVKLQQARCNRRRLLEEEEKWCEELRRCERYTWQTRYTKAVTALEEEREVRRDLEKKLEENSADKVKKLQKQVEAKEAELKETIELLQETRTQLMSVAAKYEQSEQTVSSLQINLNEAEQKLNSPRLKKCMEFMKVMMGSGDKSEQ